MRNSPSILRKTLGYVMMILLLVACNSNKKSEAAPINSEQDVNVNKSEAPLQEAITSRSHFSKDTIVIEGMQFHPAELHIKKGDTVVWINKDIVTHDATEFPDKEWTSGPLASGSSWKMKVDKSYDYFCSIHITMKGKLIVDP